MTKHNQFCRTVPRLAVLLLGASLTYFCFYNSPEQHAPPTKQKEVSSYFISTPVVKFSQQVPYINVQIGKQHLTAELDLGFSGIATMASEILQQIPEQQFIGTTSTYGVRGKQYAHTIYSISSIAIGAISFSSLHVYEENQDLIADARILPPGTIPEPHATCRLGWKLFQPTNLLLDCPHSTIAFCDGVETLKRHNCAIETFTKVALLLDRNLLEFEAFSPTKGTFRCFLDSGATYNILHTDLQNGESLDERVLNQENIVELPSFVIGGTDFGPLSFLTLPINLPVPFEVILGADFLLNHTVFICFSENAIYFAPTTPSESSQPVVEHESEDNDKKLFITTTPV